ncbi:MULTISPECIES: TetR/AcrR family transcriptional regulator [Nocardia]|uniref:TetR/AcrR family transcriptional regulator n=1 Tax=Nocardia TaxID=1817 RepID=UPI001893AF83|nr:MULTISPECIES: TetR/AcrR family transcriptional regulator [Nocardia]MBF6351992.1 TetR family transcriptional regulator [Nocardia flavorosea]
MLTATPPDSPPLDLRARRRNATRIEIREAALALFERQGVDRTTSEEIARAAGISQRTFFRYFATKEECVLFDSFGFDEAVHSCLETADMGSLSLADMETAIGRMMEGIRNDEQSEVAATALRIQKLVSTDAALSRAAVAHYADNAERSMALIEGRCPAADRSRVRAIVRVAQLAVQLACEEWVEASAPGGDDSDLASIYRTVCARIRTL